MRFMTLFIAFAASFVGCSFETGVTGPQLHGMYCIYTDKTGVGREVELRGTDKNRILAECTALRATESSTDSDTVDTGGYEHPNDGNFGPEEPLEILAQVHETYAEICLQGGNPGDPVEVLIGLDRDMYGLVNPEVILQAFLDDDRGGLPCRDVALPWQLEPFELVYVLAAVDGPASDLYAPYKSRVWDRMVIADPDSPGQGGTLDIEIDVDTGDTGF
ncbi:MAG: hypothetical protein O3B64_02860 [bacterium]|nr:hypothetical protein [bacterium]